MFCYKKCPLKNVGFILLVDFVNSYIFALIGIKVNKKSLLSVM